MYFRNREDAARQLAERLKGRKLRDPLVLAIPRGGVLTGAVLAQEIGAELDVVLARKLRAPRQPELAVGGISEEGKVYLNPYAANVPGLTKAYLEQERQFQVEEIARRQGLFRSARPQSKVKDRTVIVTDDGIATGSTMIAALQTLKAQEPYEVIVAVPVAPPDRVTQVRGWCDDLVCLRTPEWFWAIGEFYDDFRQVDDEEVIELLRRFSPASERTCPESDDATVSRIQN